MADVEFFAYNIKKKQWVPWNKKNNDCLKNRTLIKIKNKVKVVYNNG